MRRAAIVLLLLAAVCASCKREPSAAPSQPASRPDVMLISIDTLRADALRIYDPRGIETPAIAGLTRDSLLFRRAVSQIPYTLPSHCTILSGVYPVGHGVKDNVHDQLPESIPTLAALFKKQGYHTAGFIGSMVLGKKTGLGRGFDFYDDFFSRADIRAGDLGGVERRAADVFASFQHWYDHREPGNSFMFLHFYDPHSPYEPPPGYAASSSQADLYRGEIRYVDDVLGRLFQYLKNKGAWNNTVVLLTSDHGEMLEEHSEIGHGFFLYQPALAVPLILHVPGRPGGGTFAEPVQLVDIAPTLLDAAAVPVPGSLQGESLLPLFAAGVHKKNRLAFSESYFAALQMGVSPIFSVQDSTGKYIDSPRPEFYNLTSDPGESRNLVEEQKSEARQFQTRIQQYLKSYSNAGLEAEKRKVSSEEAEQFAALGYLGGQISESSWDRKKDPKDYIGDWNRSLEATYLVEHGSYAQALPLLQKIREGGAMPAESVILLEAKCREGLGDTAKAEAVLLSAGATPGALSQLAGLYARTGRPEKANEAYVRVLQEDFSYFALFDYVLFLQRAGKTAEAVSLIRQAGSRPDSASGRPFFAEMYMACGQFSDAQSILSGLLAERPWEAKWYIELSAAYQAQGQVSQALALMEPVAAQFASDPEFMLRLGILYNASGQKQKEMETFQQMIRSFPADPRPYFYLSKAMLETRQNPATVIELAQRGLSLNPTPDMQIFGHYMLGNAYQATGRSADSRKEFDLAQKLERQLQKQ